MVSKILSVISIIAPSLILQGCVPVAVVGAGALVGSSAVEERGIGKIVSDTSIRTAINAAWFDYDPQISEMVELSVREGKVLLTGQIDTVQRQIDAVRLVWTVEGVREVIDETKIGEGSGFGAYASDAWITAKLKTSLMFEGEIHSINYTLKTVDGVVYLMGIAQNQRELDRILEITRSISGVKNIVNYVRLKEGALQNMPTDPAESGVLQPQPLAASYEGAPSGQPSQLTNESESQVQSFPAPLAQ
jgi:osmotically-inducible protein OsmY